MLKYRIMKGKNLKEDNMIKNSSRVDFSLPETNVLLRSLRSVLNLLQALQTRDFSPSGLICPRCFAIRTRLCSVRPQIRLAMTKPAFTLAEVLITLGIIGIVAALTLPAVIGNYNRRVVETRLKKAYSVYTQASMRIVGNIDTTFEGNNSEEAIEFYKHNYSKYINSTKIEDGNGGVLVGLADGSGMLLWCRGKNGNVCENFEYVLLCPKYADCKDIQPRMSIPESTADGYRSFMLYASGSFTTYHLQFTDGSRESLKNVCKENGAYCLNLIAHDGWKIEDDYPHLSKIKR
ncbi:type II secretion system protein [bacterium]|nr:type II secretion system protein [bacterium]